MPTGKKVAVLIESDYYENEIFYYQYRFREEGVRLEFLSRLWGQKSLTFAGHEHKVPFVCDKSFEDITDAQLREYAAIIVPSGIVSDRLRYTERPGDTPPASDLMRRAFREKSIVKGIICHGMWLMAPVVESIRGRRATVHNNLVSDARAYGVEYVDEDVVEDHDLITARTGAHAHLLARAVIDRITADQPKQVVA